MKAKYQFGALILISAFLVSTIDARASGSYVDPTKARKKTNPDGTPIAGSPNPGESGKPDGSDDKSADKREALKKALLKKK